eukprot:TRINITY_DN884_c3_g1_i4.p1 TRINITY_DN884_c3_g1~~TRINITY_DN884_c3_g1_i4.p1  ORF type:complete len:1091 (-),score=328.00 TRINITY_DN884_c3_g1_i4:1802-5074(-)
MANPFLFDCPPAAAQEANPFLADVPVQPPPSQVQPPNPFLAEAQAAVPSQLQGQPAYYNGAHAMAPNPFAAEAYAPPSNAQQYYGQYGQYPQMQGYPQAPPAPETNLTGAAAFGVSKKPAEEQPHPPPPPPEQEIPNQEPLKEPSPSPPPPPPAPEEPPIKEPAQVQPLASTASDKDISASVVENGDEVIDFKEQTCAVTQQVEALTIQGAEEKENEVIKEDTLVKAEEQDVSSPTQPKEEEPVGAGFSGIFTNESGDNEVPSSESEAAGEKKGEDKNEAVNESKNEENKEEKEKAADEQPQDTSVGTSLFGTSTIETEKKLDLTAAAYGDDEEVKDVESVLRDKTAPRDHVEEPLEPKMSTGDAIFADLPAMPDLSSTGASIFGVSEEAASGSTGATLFGVQAPKEARPELGAMSGWDDAFDQKFETAESEVVSVATKPGDPFDPFLTSVGTVQSHDPFGVGDTVANKVEGFGFDDGFSQAKSIIAVKKAEENPFLDTTEPIEDEPLFDDDTSQPLDPFPRLDYTGDGWEMFLRHPPKKKLTSQRFWKKCYVRLAMQGDNPTVVLFENKESKDPFQELPLQSAYSVSDVSHQVFDQYSKIFTLKLQYIFYKERAGIRPGQMTKMQKLTGKIGFLAKAVEDADYEGVKEFASDMKKLGVPLEHAPQISELLKLGSYNFEDLKQFTVCIEEKLFSMDIHRDRSLTYKTEEVQLTAVDELYVEQDKSGKILKQLARVRVFFCSFLTGMPDVELGVNDMARMGLEVVGRHDILPVPTEQWIRYEDIEFHSVIDKKAFEAQDHIIKFQPPDACYLELIRFRVRPPRGRELPLIARCNFEITGNNVVIRADMLIPYHHTKAWGQVPCEDVAMRIPLPECWIYQFRTEKHHLSLSQIATGNLNLSTRMGSVKSAHRRAGKVKGLERFLGTMETHSQELMETSSGQAKYEHQHKAIVWRVPRLPKHGQGSYTTHEFLCKLQLTSFDQMPEQFEKNFYVEFTQPATAVSHTVLRSVSISGGSDEPPEKFVKYLARHEYKLEIEFSEKEQNTYLEAAKKKPPPPEDEKPTHNPEAYVGQPEFPDEAEEKNPKESDSDSD